MKNASAATPVHATHLRSALRVNAGQSSLAGRKTANEDAVGIRIPSDPLLTTKGIALAIADGVTDAEHGKEASDICVQNFLSDYYSTPDAWSVKTSVQRVLTALNRWLYSQGVSSLAPHRGYVTTLSVLVIKSQVGYVFHVGDSRIYRFREGTLEQLTTDHVTRISPSKEYLARAVGIDVRLDIDFRQVDLQEGDVFLTCTDGVHQFVNRSQLESLIANNKHDIEHACIAINEAALANGSDDNTSCQLLRIDQLSNANDQDIYQKLSELSFPPALQPGAMLDGLRILEELHASKRSQVYRVRDESSNALYVMKTPSPNFEDDPAYIERFVLEEWIGSRIDSANVVKVITPPKPRKFLYYLVQNIDGQPLGRWLKEFNSREINTAIRIIKNIGRGLGAIHRRETLHQDLKPDNILIDKQGNPVIIDFGSCRVAGIQEIHTPIERDTVLGTLDYSAPEVLTLNPPTRACDIYSLAIIAYEMLTGKHPYGEAYARCKTIDDFKRLEYRPAWSHNPLVPVWLDGALKKALQIDPQQRYQELSEFLFDLEHPNKELIQGKSQPWVERNPLRFWQAFSAALFTLHMLWLFLWIRQ